MPNCLDAHTDPAQYPWLSDINGGIDHIEFEEPAGSGNWQPYTMQTWQIHCDQNIIDHDPSNLVESHMSSFVNPSTRFAKLLYYFIDGTFREPLQTDYVQIFFNRQNYTKRYSNLMMKVSKNFKILQ